MIAAPRIYLTVRFCFQVYIFIYPPFRLLMNADRKEPILQNQFAYLRVITQATWEKEKLLV